MTSCLAARGKSRTGKRMPAARDVGAPYGVPGRDESRPLATLGGGRVEMTDLDGKRGKPSATARTVRTATTDFPPFPPSLGNRGRDSHMPQPDDDDTLSTLFSSTGTLLLLPPRGHCYCLLA